MAGFLGAWPQFFFFFSHDWALGGFVSDSQLSYLPRNAVVKLRSARNKQPFFSLTSLDSRLFTCSDQHTALDVSCALLTGMRRHLAFGLFFFPF